MPRADMTQRKRQEDEEEEEEGGGTEFSIVNMFAEISLRSDIEHGSLLRPLAFLDRL